MSTAYQAQDRGSQSDYLNYLSAMDAISVEKVASASVFFDPSPGNTLVDVGMASGTSTCILATLFPQLTVVGVDINPTMVDIAARRYSLPNLKFVEDDGEKLSTFQNGTIGGFLNCSSIHHITSFNSYDPNRAFNTLKRQAELLKPGGVIVVRDFVKPPEMEVIIELSAIPGDNCPSDADLLVAFSRSARSLAHRVEQGFPLKELPQATSGYRRFRLQHSDAVEFVRRKDYYANWDVELQEEYGYYTQEEFEDIFASLGLRVVVSNPIYNQWIIKNRYRGQFTLYDLEMNDIGFPPTNYLIAGEKVMDHGTHIHLVRHLPEADKPFLKYASYQHGLTGEIFDVVSRPNSVFDVIPYHLHEGKLHILAKHGYPRPLASITTDSPEIDGKHFGGYITEGITVSLGQHVDSLLHERLLVKGGHGWVQHEALGYYPSPGGIDEMVQSVLVELSGDPDHVVSQKAFGGYTDSGSIRKFDALQLLKTAQTGALVEARLELNVFHLLRELSLPLPEWMGETILPEEKPLHPVTVADVLKETANHYRPSSETANYLQKRRAKFVEAGSNGGSSVLEYVIPDNKSVNTLVTLPIFSCGGQIYVGLEMRSLPVPQLHSGNSMIATAPAVRLPKSVSTMKHLENYLQAMDVSGAKVVGFNRLGEKFFPSIGLTPEQVYPYVVTLSEAVDGLKWVSLTELMENFSSLKDGHLLICIARLFNALRGK